MPDYSPHGGKSRIRVAAPGRAGWCAPQAPGISWCQGKLAPGLPQPPGPEPGPLIPASPYSPYNAATKGVRRHRAPSLHSRSQGSPGVVPREQTRSQDDGDRTYCRAADRAWRFSPCSAIRPSNPPGPSACSHPPARGPGPPAPHRPEPSSRSGCRPWWVRSRWATHEGWPWNGAPRTVPSDFQTNGPDATHQQKYRRPDEGPDGGLKRSGQAWDLRKPVATVA